MRSLIFISLAACAVDDIELSTLEEEITYGSPDLGNPTTNATVSIVLGNAYCSGTLVAPDIVLTAAHCLGRDNWCAQTEVANRWYPLSATEFPSGVQVRFGHDSVGVTVNRVAAQSWETFTIGKASGTAIAHGDGVHFRTHNNHYLSAQDGAGKWVDAIRPWALGWETFTIERVAGPGTVKHGDFVTLRSYGNNYVVVANDGVNPVLHATGSDPALARFRIRNTTGATGDLAAGMTISLQGNNDKYVAAEHGGGAWIHVAPAIEYSIPNGSDIALLKLSAPVPWVATPARVLTRPSPFVSGNPETFWAAQTVRIAGWGGTNLGSTVAGRYRQTANVTGVDPDCLEGVNGQCLTSNTNIASGDSGGPTFWTDPSGVTHQIAVTDGVFVPTNPVVSYHQTTFEAGGFPTCNGSKTYPNIAVWLETMLGLTQQCTPISPSDAVIEPFAGSFRLRSSTSGVIEGNFRNAAEAGRALAIMQHYGMDQRCMVGNTVEYNLTDLASPTGTPRSDEDCLAIWAPGLTVVNQGGDWVLRQGSSSLLSLGTSETIARITLGTIRRYDFRQLCFVARPNPAWTYFRR